MTYPPLARFTLAALTLCLSIPMSHSQEPAPSPAAIPAHFSNPVSDAYLADPQCFYYQGTYYAVGTGQSEAGDETLPDKVIPMIKSRDLQHWEPVGHLLTPPSEERGGSFWAPEIHLDNATFYLYYASNGGGKDDKGFHLRVATSKNPEGPYTDTGHPLTDLARNNFAIDATAFRDDDGQWYLFYATDFYDSDATTFRGTALVMDKLKTMTELDGHPQTVMRAHWSWQLYLHNRLMGGVRADWYTLEGPCVTKHGGKYYCFYSGGNYANDTYGVDYLVADQITGPWRETGQYRGPPDHAKRSQPGHWAGPQRPRHRPGRPRLHRLPRLEQGNDPPPDVGRPTGMDRPRPAGRPFRRPHPAMQPFGGGTAWAKTLIARMSADFTSPLFPGCTSSGFLVPELSLEMHPSAKLYFVCPVPPFCVLTNLVEASPFLILPPSTCSPKPARPSPFSSSPWASSC